MDPTVIWSAMASAVAGILAYMLREKNEIVNKLSTDIAELKVFRAVQAEKNETVDERLNSIDGKLDRILEKLGA